MKRLFIDLCLFATSIVVAVGIVEFDVVPKLLEWSGEGFGIASFIAGMFFTSVVTTIPAMAILGELGREGNLLLVATLGGLGAVVGDYIIFAFVRDRVAEDIAHFMSRSTVGRLRALVRRKTFRWLLPLLGGLIIASPFPDELGLLLLGFSQLRTSMFIPLSFCFNAAGILAIGLVARAL